MNIPHDELEKVLGRTVVDTEGHKVGKAGDIYMDEQTGQPEWLAVETGFFGTRVSFVPFTEATLEGDSLRVPFGEDTVKSAPTAEADGSLSQEDEAQLYAHYGLDYSESRSNSGLPEGAHYAFSGSTTQPGEDREEESTGGAHFQSDDSESLSEDKGESLADNAMTRSEEEADVSTETRQTGTARLRKYVVTEQQTVTVPVSHEEVSLEREPITDENYEAATSGPDISEAEHEVVLNEEVPVVDTKVVPKERVRLGTETVTGEEEVSADVRKEQIDLDDSEVDTKSDR